MVNSQIMPKWSTPDRREKLVQFWIEYGNRCLYGHQTCPIASHYIYDKPQAVKAIIPKIIKCRDSADNPIMFEGKQVTLTVYGTKTILTKIQTVARLYDIKSELAIENWKDSDKEQSQAERKAERKALHDLGEIPYPTSGRFTAIDREIFAGNQPLYYFEGQAVSGLTFKPFVRVRIASSYMRLDVDLGETLRQVSKSRRRKAVRYGKALPLNIKREINKTLLIAVMDYYSH